MEMWDFLVNRHAPNEKWETWRLSVKWVGNDKINIFHKTHANETLKLFASFGLMQTEKEKRWQFIVNPFMIKSGVVIFCP